MQRPAIPGSVTLGRALVIVESALWLLAGLGAGGFGALVAATPLAGINNRLQQIGYSGTLTNAQVAHLGVTLIVIGVIIVVAAVIGIWSGAAMGRFSSGPRTTAIVLACLGLVIGVAAAINGTHATTVAHTGLALRNTPIPGIVIVVVNLLIVWTLAFSGSTRAAFRGLPPAAYPMTAPAPAVASFAAYAPSAPPPAPLGEPDATLSDVPPPPPPPPPPDDLQFAVPSDDLAVKPELPLYIPPESREDLTSDAWPQGGAEVEPGVPAGGPDEVPAGVTEEAPAEEQPDFALAAAADVPPDSPPPPPSDFPADLESDVVLAGFPPPPPPPPPDVADDEMPLDVPVEYPPPPPAP